MITRTLLLTILTVVGCSSPVTPPTPTRLVVNYGPTAISIPGHQYDTIEVRLFDDAGLAIIDWPVVWEGDGEVTPLDERTDGVGIARATWTLPRTDLFFNGATDGPIGTFTLHAEAVGVGGVSMSTTTQAFEVDRVVAGYSFACGWRGTEFWCWGDPWSIGPITDFPHRVTLPNGDHIVEAVIAADLLCVTDEQGIPWCAVRSRAGEFEPVTGSPAVHGLTAGDDLACGISRLDGTPWCWTAWAYPDPPVAEQRVQLSPTALALGLRFGCGLMADSAAWCWGDNTYGQLGVGTTSPTDGAQQVQGGHRFVALVAGDRVACGATSDGAVWCWGRFLTQVTSPSPQLVDDRPGTLQQLAVGRLGEVYVLRDGEARIILTRIDELLNDRYFVGRQVRQISVEYESLCMVLVSNQVRCSVSTFGPWRTDQFYPEEVGPVPDPRAIRTRQPVPVDNRVRAADSRAIPRPPPTR